MKKLFAGLVALGALAAGGWLYLESRRPSGFVLISIDTLRADHLGAYGYRLDTSPFFDEFAERGTLFENAIVQLPGTLPSHMSIFTGLYPAEHGVFPPDSVLSQAIETMPEIFSAAGYRTAGFTEGGYVAGRYGFERGFDLFRAENTGKPGAAGRTFALAKEWISSLLPGEEFFLFVHTYEVHDPYVAKEPYGSNSWPHEPPDIWEPTGANLTAASLGDLPVTPEAVEYFNALYDAGIRYVDDELRSFMEHLWASGLSRDTVVVITSDHGEEFLEHGSFVHRQVYNETLHVPLLIRELGQRTGRRVADLVESVDILPTLLELADLEPEAHRVSGESLVDLLDGGGPELGAEAYSEAFGAPSRSIYRQTEDGLFQLVLTSMKPSGSRVPVGRSISFDWLDSELVLTVSANGSPRDVVLSVDGVAVGTHSLKPGEESEIRFTIAATRRKHRIVLTSDECEPLPSDEAGRSCVGFFLHGLSPERRELFRIDTDPLGQADLSGLRPALGRDLEIALESYRWDVRATAEREDLTEAEIERLKALGYLQ